MADGTPTKDDAAPPPAPIFGSAATFGGTGGFGGFTGAGFGAATTSPAKEGDDADAAPDDAECQAQFTPVVQLKEVETKTGEENEDVMFESKCKLYRFHPEGNEWKERGVGPVKLLKHKVSGKVRLIMRADKVMKVRANHLVLPGVSMTSHGGNDKAWVWTIPDFSQDEEMLPEDIGKPQMFAIRFATAEKANDFKGKFEEAQAINEPLLEEGGEGPGPGAAAAADNLAEDLASKASVAEGGAKQLKVEVASVNIKRIDMKAYGIERPRCQVTIKLDDQEHKTTDEPGLDPVWEQEFMINVSDPSAQKVSAVLHCGGVKVGDECTFLLDKLVKGKATFKGLVVPGGKVDMMFTAMDFGLESEAKADDGFLDFL